MKEKSVMSLLKRLFGERVSKRDTTLASPVRMQALGLLTTYLEHRFEARVILTQVSIVVTPVRENELSTTRNPRCDAFIQAYFAWEGYQKGRGWEGKAPLPPCVVAEIWFESEPDSQVLKWSPSNFEVTMTNLGGPIDEPEKHYELDCHDYIRDFNRWFNEERPWGFSIMPAMHDQTIWNINPKETESAF